jgi:hypothetical protein
MREVSGALRNLALIFGGSFVAILARDGNWYPVFLFGPVIALIALDALSNVRIK